MNGLVALVRLARPKQWVKNGLLFAALIFSGHFVDAGPVSRTLLAFVAFSLLLVLLIFKPTGILGRPVFERV